MNPTDETNLGSVDSRQECIEEVRRYEFEKMLQCERRIERTPVAKHIRVIMDRGLRIYV